MMYEKPVNYAKLHHGWRQHHVRFKRRVLSRTPRLVCQECRGMGGAVEPVLDFGQGPFMECGWCEGTGYVDPHRRAFWLKTMREDKQKRRRSSPVSPVVGGAS